MKPIKITTSEEKSLYMKNTEMSSSRTASSLWSRRYVPWSPAYKAVVDSASYIQGTSVSEETEYRHRLYHNVEKGGSLSIRDSIYAYRGRGEPPNWFDDVEDSSKFWEHASTTVWLKEKSDTLKLLCNVEATIPKVPDNGGNVASVGSSGRPHQQFYYHVLLFFGGPELRAQIGWTDNVSLHYLAQSPFHWPARLCFLNSTGWRKEVRNAFESLFELD